MMRLVIVGCGVLWSGAVFAQNPVSVYPTRQAQPMPPPAAMPVVNQPLPQVVATGLAPAPMSCASCTHAAACPLHRRASRPCLQRIFDWVTYRPCPRVLPVLTPTPYQAPLRTYFPCKPDACGAGAPGCATHCRPNLLPRLHGAPAACGSCPAPRVSLVSRFLRFFDPRPHPYTSGTWSGGCGTNGDCPCPPTGAYRYAAPCVVPPPSSPYQPQGAGQSMSVPAVNRPFTTP